MERVSFQTIFHCQIRWFATFYCYLSCQEGYKTITQFRWYNPHSKTYALVVKIYNWWSVAMAFRQFFQDRFSLTELKWTCNSVDGKNMQFHNFVSSHPVTSATSYVTFTKSCDFIIWQFNQGEARFRNPKGWNRNFHDITCNKFFTVMDFEWEKCKLSD